MKGKFLIAAAATALFAGSAQAADVYYTDLPVYNAGFPINASTTTDAHGRTTTASPLFGSASATAPASTWRQTDLQAGATVGITDTYSNDGDGAIYFASNSNSGKASLSYAFSAPVALSSLSSVSFDWFVDPVSATTSVYSPVLRLAVTRPGGGSGTLVLEHYYQNNSFGSEGVWTSESASLTSGNWWNTVSQIGGTNATEVKTLADWLAKPGNSGIMVSGISIGIGSGWGSGAFRGAVDNVAFNFTGGPAGDFNFKVIDLPPAVPEPATWAMMIGGFALAGSTLRRRRTNIQFA